MASLLSKNGIDPGWNPITRVSNFVVFVGNIISYAIIDSTPPGGLPNQYYQDIRGTLGLVPVSELQKTARDQLGFKDDKTILIPTSILQKSEYSKDDMAILNELSEEIFSDIKSMARFRSLNIPSHLSHLKPDINSLLNDHPDYDKNVFIMMRFEDSDQHDDIFNTINDTISNYGMRALRADMKQYNESLLENVLVYILSCKYGIAVFEEINQREFNPNVALELGFMMSMNKRCMLLKDSRMPKMPTDVIGRLYKEFDSYNIDTSVHHCTSSWLRDLDIA